MFWVPDREESISFTRGGLVPIALDEQAFASAGTVDIFPRLRRAEGKFIGSGPHNGAILVVELLDLEKSTAVEPSRYEPELLTSALSLWLPFSRRRNETNRCSSGKPRTRKIFQRVEVDIVYNYIDSV